MTIIVGIKAKDGVVIASDSAATNDLGKISVNKIHNIDNQIIFASAGDSTRDKSLKLVISRAKDTLVKDVDPFETAQTISGLMHQMVKRTNSDLVNFGAMVGIKEELMFFHGHNFQPDLLDSNNWFQSIGSGSGFANPFLDFQRRALWRRQPDLTDAVFASIWAVYHTIQTAPAGVDKPIRVSYIYKNKVTDVDNDYVIKVQKEVDGLEATIRRDPAIYEKMRFFKD